MQILERRDSATLWVTRDAQGYRVYGVTQDQDGVAIEPHSLICPSQRQAWQVYHDDEVFKAKEKNEKI